MLVYENPADRVRLKQIILLAGPVLLLLKIEDFYPAWIRFARVCKPTFC